MRLTLLKKFCLEDMLVESLDNQICLNAFLRKLFDIVRLTVVSLADFFVF